MAKKAKRATGLSVDRSGVPVVDPTENVKALSAATSERQDDLAELRAFYTMREMEMRSDHSNELSSKEAARIDANRSQDQDSARRATETALTAVQALAVQAPITADAVRGAQTALLNPVLERLTNIERVQYEQAGSKAQVGESRTGAMQTWQIVAISASILFGAGGFFLGLVGTAVALYLSFHG